jgi:hypothetical protein
VQSEGQERSGLRTTGSKAKEMHAATAGLDHQVDHIMTNAQLRNLDLKAR